MKKNLFALCTALIFSFSLSGQNMEEDTIKIKELELEEIEELEDDPIFTIVEKMPLFNGATSDEESIEKVFEHIGKCFEGYTPDAKGTVFINFVVDENGNVINVKLLRGIDSNEANKLSLKCVSEMPRWTPGTQRGKAVKVSYNLPIRFK